VRNARPLTPQLTRDEKQAQSALFYRETTVRHRFSIVRETTCSLGTVMGTLKSKMASEARVWKLQGGQTESGARVGAQATSGILHAVTARPLP
jgi:hypothetical protein